MSSRFSGAFISQKQRRKLYDTFGGLVYYGPFSTLKIQKKMFGILEYNEILGTYESCLHEAILNLTTKNYKTIMIIGAYHGYYVAGLALISNCNEVIAFEKDVYLHEVIRSWWDVNDLPRLTLKAEATIDEMTASDNNTGFVFCDCEGDEISLLDPQKFPWQAHADFIIELHDFYKPGILKNLRSRFSKTHKCQVIFDNLNERELNKSIIEPFKIKLNFDEFPLHRWIRVNNVVTYTFGRFLILEKNDS